MRIKDGRDVAIKEVNADNYVVPRGEEHLYHVKQEVKQFDRNTGAQLTKPCVQKYGKKMYETSISDDLRKQGYTVVVLHDPNDFIAAKAAERSAKAAEMAEAKAKAEAEAKEAEKAALKAEIMAELEAAGIIQPAPGSEETEAAGEKSKKAK